MKEYLTYEEMDKYIKALKSVTVKCKCGHSVTITSRHKRVICNWCGEFVYLDPKDEFKNKLKKTMKKVKNENERV